jgi:hypothetical protein
MDGDYVIDSLTIAAVGANQNAYKLTLNGKLEVLSGQAGWLSTIAAGTIAGGQLVFGDGLPGNGPEFDWTAGSFLGTQVTVSSDCTFHMTSSAGKYLEEKRGRS